MSSASAPALEPKKSSVSANPKGRHVVSTEVKTLGRSNRVTVTFSNGDILYAYGNSDQKICV